MKLRRRLLANAKCENEKQNHYKLKLQTKNLSLLVNIDTATEHASVCISENGNVLGIEKSFEQKDHASFIQPAIKKLFENIHRKISEIDAVSVTAGPGSYTGLRVGLSTAKG